MYTDNKDLNEYLAKSFKNTVKLIDVLRLSMLPKAVKTNYPTIVEDGITYYMLNYERYNNIDETLKIPHLTEYIGSLVTNNYISPNISKNNVTDSSADSLIFNYNSPKLNKLAFIGGKEIHNVQYNTTNTKYFRDIIMGNNNGESVIIDYDFENLYDFGTAANGYHVNADELKINIIGATNYKYAKTLTHYANRVPTAVYNGVHVVFPDGVGFDANDVTDTYMKQSIYDKFKYIETVSAGVSFNLHNDDDNYIVKVDTKGISVDDTLIYDIKNNYIKNVNITRTNIYASTITSSYLSYNRFKTLNYSYNNIDNDGMVIGWSENFKQPCVSAYANNASGYFTFMHVGFKNDDLKAYFSASYFNFNDKIKMFKITELGDMQFSWGSYFRDTRNIYCNSKIEVGNSSELFIDHYARIESFGEVSFRNQSIRHVSKRVKTVTSADPYLRDGYTVFNIVGGTPSTYGAFDEIYIDGSLSDVGTEIIVINSTVEHDNSNTNIQIYELNNSSGKTHVRGLVNTGDSATLIKVNKNEWVVL